MEVALAYRWPRSPGTSHIHSNYSLIFSSVFMFVNKDLNGDNKPFTAIDTLINYDDQLSIMKSAGPTLH